MALHASDQDIISEVAIVDGIPPWIPVDIALGEGHGSILSNAVNARDLNGYASVGAFQLNTAPGNPGNGYSISQLQDTQTNAKVAIPLMLPAYKQGYAQGLRGKQLLDYVANNSGWPGTNGQDERLNGTTYDTILNQQYDATSGQYKDSTGAVTGSANLLQKTDVNGAFNTFADWIKQPKNYIQPLTIILGSILIILLLYRIFTH